MYNNLGSKTRRGAKVAVLLGSVAAISACSGSGGGTPSPNKLNIAVADKPVRSAVTALDHTGNGIANPVNDATFDADNDTITIDRSVGSVTMTGSTQPAANLKRFEDTSGQVSVVSLAQTTDGNGYAVAYRDGANTTDPEASIFVGGASTTATPQAGATFNGKYTGQASGYALGATLGNEETRGDVTLSIGGTNNAPTVSGTIGQRTSGSNNAPLATITLAPAAISGAGDFTAAASTTAPILGSVVSGTATGTFFETDQVGAGADEVVGAVVVNNPSCTATIADAGGSCVLESGVFHAAN